MSKPLTLCAAMWCYTYPDATLFVLLNYGIVYLLGRRPGVRDFDHMIIIDIDIGPYDMTELGKSRRREEEGKSA